MLIETAHAATEAVTTAEAAGGIGALGLDLKLFLAQLLNFGILVFVMWKWVYVPLMKTMDERSKKIQDGLDFAAQATTELNEAAAERAAVIRDARIEAHALLDDAAAKAELLRKEKIAQSAVEIDKMVADAKVRMAQEREATVSALTSELGALVTLATRKVALGTDEKAREFLVAKAIEDIAKV
jgi:F-type H+-transporting ATPase subunit b